MDRGQARRWATQMKRLSLTISVAPSSAISFVPFGRPFVSPLCLHTQKAVAGFRGRPYVRVPVMPPLVLVRCEVSKTPINQVRYHCIATSTRLMWN